MIREVSHCMISQQKHIRETVLMKSHKICFYGEILKITSVTLLTWSTGILGYMYRSSGKTEQTLNRATVFAQAFLLK